MTTYECEYDSLNLRIFHNVRTQDGIRVYTVILRNINAASNYFFHDYHDVYCKILWIKKKNASKLIHSHTIICLLHHSTHTPACSISSSSRLWNKIRFSNSKEEENNCCEHESERGRERNKTEAIKPLDLKSFSTHVIQKSILEPYGSKNVYFFGKIACHSASLDS